MARHTTCSPSLARFLALPIHLLLLAQAGRGVVRGCERCSKTEMDPGPSHVPLARCPTPAPSPHRTARAGSSRCGDAVVECPHFSTISGNTPSVLPVLAETDQSASALSRSPATRIAGLLPARSRRTDAAPPALSRRTDALRGGRQLRRVLPHVVTGVCILLLGLGLLYSSFTAWGGPPPTYTPHLSPTTRPLSTLAPIHPATHNSPREALAHESRSPQPSAVRRQGALGGSGLQQNFDSMPHITSSPPRAS